MSTGPTNLADLAATLLNVCARALDDDGGGAPAVQWIHAGAGAPVAYGESLVVSFVRMRPGPPTDASPSQLGKVLFLPWSAELSVYVYREKQGGLHGEGLELTGLDTDAETADATQAMTDAFVLNKGIVAAHSAGTFRDYSQGLMMVGAEPIAEQGNLTAIVLQIVAELS